MECVKDKDAMDEENEGEEGRSRYICGSIHLSCHQFDDGWLHGVVCKMTYFWMKVF